MFDNLFILVGPFGSAAILFATLMSVAGVVSIGRCSRIGSGGATE